MNQVRLTGWVTFGPELRYTVRDVATLDVWIDPRRSKSTRHQGFREGVHVVAQGKLAEFGAENLHKGKRVLIEGKLTVDDRKPLEGQIDQGVAVLATKVDVGREAQSVMVRPSATELVKPALRRFKSDIKTMKAAEAAEFLNQVVGPFLQLYERHRSSFSGSPALALCPKGATPETADPTRSAVRRFGPSAR